MQEKPEDYRIMVLGEQMQAVDGKQKIYLEWPTVDCRIVEKICHTVSVSVRLFVRKFSRPCHGFNRN